MAHKCTAAMTAATDQEPQLVARNLLPSDARISHSSISASARTTGVMSSPSSSSTAAAHARSFRRRKLKCLGNDSATSTSSSPALSLDDSSSAISNVSRHARHLTSPSQPMADFKRERRREISSPHQHQARHSRHRRPQTIDIHAGNARVTSDIDLDTVAYQEHSKATIEQLPTSYEHDSGVPLGKEARDTEERTSTQQQRQAGVSAKPSRMIVKRRTTAPVSSPTVRRPSSGALTQLSSPRRHPFQSVDTARATHSPPCGMHVHGCSPQRSTRTLDTWHLRVQKSISGSSSGTDGERSGTEHSLSKRLVCMPCNPQFPESPAPFDPVVASRCRRRQRDSSGQTRDRIPSRGLRQPASLATVETSYSPPPPPPCSLSTDRHSGSTTPRALARKIPLYDENATNGATGPSKARPVRIRYESPMRSKGEKREISHASLGKLVAHLTDAHQFDTEFRDVFLLTYCSFCSPYDLIKKLLKRYTAVLSLCGTTDAQRMQAMQQVMDQLTLDEESILRLSNVTSVSTARSDIQTGMEANVSIMRLLSVLKFWIKESTYIEQDLAKDRKAQKKLVAFLKEIQTMSPIPSVRRHAENLLLTVAQVLSALKQQAKAGSQRNPAKAPPPLTLVTCASESVLPDRPGSRPECGGSQDPSSAVAQAIGHQSDSGERVLHTVTKLALPRSSSDPRREWSIQNFRTKNPHGDIFHHRSRSIQPGADDQASATRDRVLRTNAVPVAAAVAPKIARGITTGSAEAMVKAKGIGDRTDGFDAMMQDTLQRARLTAASRKSARISYDNVEPLAGFTALELADQLTLMEAEQYFSKLNPRELTNKAWTRENKYQEAPHVMALIELFDATAEWVSSEILHPQLQAVERAKMITLFIEAADRCYQLNNFNSLFEISTGLSAPCIRQLNTTWSLVSAVTLEKYQCLQHLCSPDENYRSYRQAFGLAEGQPRLACWFLLVKDLFTIEEAMKSMEDGLVHWHKFRMIYRVINDALDQQNFIYVPCNTGANGSSTAPASVARKGRGILRHDRKSQVHIRHRIDTIRKDSSVLYQLARNANTQESILFVNSLSEAGFL